MTQRVQTLRLCIQCQHKWVEPTDEFVLCPNCGSPTVIRPEVIKQMNGVEILALRDELYRVMYPHFAKLLRMPIPIQDKTLCGDAARDVLGFLIKRFCHEGHGERTKDAPQEG